MTQPPLTSPPVAVFRDAADLGAALAAEIADGMQAAQREGRPYVLGCPGGRSPRSTYRALAAEVGGRGLDLSGVVIAMMDEYVEPDGESFVRVPATAHYSCRRFAHVEIVGILNSFAVGRGVPAANVWLPDPADPSAHDRRLAETGGVDLFILASGASDGHVAFNPPGTAFGEGGRVVELAETTRRDNLGTFPGFAGIDEVPRHGVTVGPRTIASLSHRVVMVVHGAHKRAAADRLREATDYDPAWPATVLTRCANPSLYLDAAAAGAPAPSS